MVRHISVKAGYKFVVVNASKLDGVTERNNMLTVAVGHTIKEKPTVEGRWART